MATYQIGDVPPNDLPDHIRSVELDIQNANLKLTNVRARLAAGTPLQTLLSTHYPVTYISLDPEATDFSRLTLTHQVWLEDTIGFRDMLRCELVLRDHLSELITDQASFMNVAAKSTVSWGDIYEILTTVVAIKIGIQK